MKYVYPAIFTTEEDCVLVSVPDLPGLHTYGGTMADAIYMAQDAIEMWLWDAESKGEAIPAPSCAGTVAKTCAPPRQTVSMVAADTDEYRRQNDYRTVRKTLSIPAWLDHQAKRANAPFSQILQDGLKRYLHIA